MLSPAERKKIGFSLLTSSSAEMKKYVDVYALFVERGYTKDLCEAYADAFIDNAKKPSPFDIIQLSSLYGRIHDYKTSYFYLEKLEDKKLSGDEKFGFCVEMLETVSKIGNWRDAEDFRTKNISFLQKYTAKASPQKEAELYIALALADCAAKNYQQALKLITEFKCLICFFAQSTAMTSESALWQICNAAVFLNGTISTVWRNKPRKYFYESRFTSSVCTSEGNLRAGLQINSYVFKNVPVSKSKRDLGELNKSHYDS